MPPTAHRGRDHAPAYPHGGDVLAAERLRLLGGHAHGGSHLRGILALEQVGIAADDGEERRALLGALDHALDPPGRELLERVIRRMPESHQLQLVVGVGDVHVGAAGGVRACGQRPGQLDRLDRCANDQPLAALQVQAHADRQVGVTFQVGVHGVSVTHRPIAYTRRGRDGTGQHERHHRRRDRRPVRRDHRHPDDAAAQEGAAQRVDARYPAAAGRPAAGGGARLHAALRAGAGGPGDAGVMELAAFHPRGDRGDAGGLRRRGGGDGLHRRRHLRRHPLRADGEARGGRAGYRRSGARRRPASWQPGCRSGVRASRRRRRWRD